MWPKYCSNCSRTTPITMMLNSRALSHCSTLQPYISLLLCRAIIQPDRIRCEDENPSSECCMIPFHLLPFSNNLFIKQKYLQYSLYSFSGRTAVIDYVVNTYIEAYYVVPVFLYQSQSQYWEIYNLGECSCGEVILYSLLSRGATEVSKPFHKQYGKNNIRIKKSSDNVS